MTDTLPKIMLAILGAVALLCLIIGIWGGSGQLEVTYENNFLKIQNVGDEPVEIKTVTINDRADCVGYQVTLSNLLKVGDSIVLFTLCDAVRTTITTASGSNTYYFH